MDDEDSLVRTIFLNPRKLLGLLIIDFDGVAHLEGLRVATVILVLSTNCFSTNAIAYCVWICPRSAGDRCRSVALISDLEIVLSSRPPAPLTALTVKKARFVSPGDRCTPVLLRSNS